MRNMKKNQDNYLVFIIILNWNGWKDTVACVESCLNLTYTNYRILIIDNKSTDGSVAELKARLPEIEIVETDRNLGFAGGNNVGIRIALDQHADYIWLLNNDTVVDPQCLSQMLQAAEADNHIGMVGSKIYYHHKSETLWFAGGEIDFENGGATRHIGQDERDEGNYDQLKEIGIE